jgi:hypothetical protein
VTVYEKQHSGLGGVQSSTLDVLQSEKNKTSLKQLGNHSKCFGINVPKRTRKNETTLK